MSDLHVIVMDMDGTLLNDNKEVSEYTKNVLRRQKEKGMKIGIASGRPILGVRRTVENLGLSDIIQFMVASNGAELYDVSDGEERGFFKLDVNTIFEIIDTYKHFDLNPYVYQGGDCYAVRNDSTIERAAKNNFLGIHLCDMRKEVTTPQSKLVLSTPPEKMSDVEKFYEAHKSEKYRAFKSQTDMFEFVHPELSKVYGIKYYCEKYGYDISKVIAFGDTTNDLEMVDECGVGVFMFNGTYDVKAVADIITEFSNDDDGLAKELEKLL